MLLDNAVHLLRARKRVGWWWDAVFGVTHQRVIMCSL